MIGLPLELPVDPSPDQARDWLREELGRSSYGQNWFEDLWRWWQNWLTGRDMADAVLGWGLIVVVLSLLAGGVAWWAWRARITTRAKAEVFADLPPEERMTAAQYRFLASQLLLVGDHDGALMAGVRAMAVDLVRRTVLSDQPGRTAHEVTRGIIEKFPDEQAALLQAAAWFDIAAYGLADSPRVTREQVSAVLALDERIAQARPRWQLAATR